VPKTMHLSAQNNTVKSTKQYIEVPKKYIEVPKTMHLSVQNNTLKCPKQYIDVPKTIH
jgi:hypothetical protein